MKRTKEWWARLTEAERSELVYLERIESRGGTGRSSYLPDDCSECPNCSTPHLGYGLCPLCSKRLDDLIRKASGLSVIDVVEHSKIIMTIELDAIKTRCKATTPSPWYVVGPPWRASYYDKASGVHRTLGTYIVAGSPDPHIGKPIIDSVEIDEWDTEAWGADYSQSDADLEFCACARTDIPALIAEIERLHKLIEQ